MNVDGCLATLDGGRGRGRPRGAHLVQRDLRDAARAAGAARRRRSQPFDPYGRSKAEAERKMAERRAAGQPIASIRPRTLVGRGRLGLFDVIFGRVRAGKRVPVFGRGTNRSQLCDVEDLCSAVLAAAERRASGDYNVGSSGYGTVREDIEALIEHAGTSAARPARARSGRSGRSSSRSTSSAARRSPSGTGARPPPTSTSTRRRPPRTSAGTRSTRTSTRSSASYDDYVRRGDAEGPSAHRRPLRGALARLLRG